jgi:glycosyltransferase involved in cell wall biosynthesis
MRILLLSQFYPPVIGGEERHVRNLAMALATRGHQVSVATQASHDDAGCTLDGMVRVHRLNGVIRRLSALFSDPERPFAPPMPDPGLTLALRRVIAQERPDIIHAHNWILHSYLPLKPFTQVPFIVTLHDYALICARKTLMYMNQAPCSGPAFRKCLRCAKQHYGGIKGGVTTVSNWIDSAYERRVVNKFLTVSDAVARLNRLPEAGVDFEVIPNFVPDNLGELSPDVDPALLAQLPEHFILMVGDLLPRKGVLVLLNAYAKLSNPPPLVLIGRRCPETPASLPPGVRLLESWPHVAIMQAWRRCLFGSGSHVTGQGHDRFRSWRHAGDGGGRRDRACCVTGAAVAHRRHGATNRGRGFARAHGCVRAQAGGPVPGHCGGQSDRRRLSSAHRNAHQDGGGMTMLSWTWTRQVSTEVNGYGV